MKKTFRVATADITIDGRNITREQLFSIAKNYDTAKYQAMINLEHFYYGGNFGRVVSVEVKEDDRGLGLYAELEPNEFLMNYNKAGQKLFTSIEIVPNFPAKGEFYLGGLAITDKPASQGIDMLSFSKNMPEHYQPPIEMSFGNFIESEIDFGTRQELDDDLTEAEAKSWLKHFKKLAKIFNKKEEEEMNKELEEKVAKFSAENEELKKQNEALKKENEEFQAKLKENESFKKELDEVKAEVEKLKAMPMSSQRDEATGKLSQDNPDY